MTRDINNTRGLSPCATILCNRFVVTLLLMMIVGVSEAWGDKMTDFEGVWYIASNGNAYEAGTTTDLQYTYDPETPLTNFYLRPAADPLLENKTDAFLTVQLKPNRS